MESSKFNTFLFISMLFISSSPPILGCGYCGNNPPHHKKHKPSKKPKLPITVPPIVDPPHIIVPQPVTLPAPTTPENKPCPPPKSPTQVTCPIDTVKLGACVDLLGGLVHIGVGDPAVNQCCPVLEGLVEVEAAACLCTTLKLKLLNLNIFVPIALQLLVACGKSPPTGYTCSL